MYLLMFSVLRIENWLRGMLWEMLEGLLGAASGASLGACLEGQLSASSSSLTSSRTSPRSSFQGRPKRTLEQAQAGTQVIYQAISQ